MAPLLRRPMFLAALAASLLCAALLPGRAAALDITRASVEPSPFSPNGDGVFDVTYIIFDLSDTADVVAVDISGSPRRPENSRTLSLPGPIAPGHYELAWDGRNNLGSTVADGRYAVTLQARRAAVVSPVLGLEAVVDLTAPVIDQVSVQPSLYAPLLPGSSPTDVRIAFTVSRFDTLFAGGDRVFVVVEKVLGHPGPKNTTDTLGVLRDSVVGDVASFHADWIPVADTSQEGVHTVRVEAWDRAGNHSGGGLWAVDLAVVGPTASLTSPPEPPKVGSGTNIYVPAFPDSIRGVAMDRPTRDSNHFVDSVRVSFGGGPFVEATLDNSTAEARWAVPFPGPTDYFHRQGSLVLTIQTVSHIGYVASVTRSLYIDTIPPGPLTLSHTPAARVARPDQIFSGLAPGSDSLFTTLTGPDGVLWQFARTVTSGTFAFGDTLLLSAGVNRVTFQGGDLAGHRSPLLTVNMEYVPQAGVHAPEVFHPLNSFSARLSAPAASVEARIYRPDGSYVRRLYTEKAGDSAARTSFDLEWDLMNDSGVLVGRGPYLCVVTVTYLDGTTEAHRLAVVAMP
jgi:hypothetical protein